jgi:hypothetical protein
MAHRRSLGFAPTARRGRRDDKGGGGASIWDLLLGSQVSNARPGAPFDFTLRHCRGHKLVISLPTRLSESASLGMTKGAVALPFGIGCWDPRSQTRDLGHPSISPFDIAEGTSLSFLSRLASASRLRSGMTKGAVALPFGIGCWDPRSQTRDLGHPSISPFDIAEGTSFVISLPTRLSESASDPRSQTGRNQGGLALCPLAQPSNLRQKVVPFRKTGGPFCGRSVVCDRARTVTSHLQQVSTNRIETMMAR